MEAVANADTVVFDKTGTLDLRHSHGGQSGGFDGYSASEMLRLAACLEEHYPHSMANAVVAEAKRLGLDHKEYHSQVEYVVAHGISSSVEDKRSSSAAPTSSLRMRAAWCRRARRKNSTPLPEEYSHLYLCIAGRLAAVICIADPCGKRPRRPLRRSTPAASARWS